MDNSVISEYFELLEEHLKEPYSELQRSKKPIKKVVEAYVPLYHPDADLFLDFKKELDNFWAKNNDKSIENIYKERTNPGVITTPRGRFPSRFIEALPKMLLFCDSIAVADPLHDTIRDAPNNKLSISLWITLGLELLENKHIFINDLDFEANLFTVPSNLEINDAYVEEFSAFNGGRLFNKKFKNNSEFEKYLYSTSPGELQKRMNECGDTLPHEDDLVLMVGKVEDEKQLAYSYKAATDYFSYYSIKSRLTADYLNGFSISEIKFDYYFVQNLSQFDLNKGYIPKDSVISSSLINASLPCEEKITLEKALNLRKKGYYDEIRSIIGKNISAIQDPRTPLDEISKEIKKNFEEQLDKEKIKVSKELGIPTLATYFGAGFSYIPTQDWYSSILVGATAALSTFGLRSYEYWSNLKNKKRPVHTLFS